MNKRNTIKQLLHRGCLLMGISANNKFGLRMGFRRAP